MKKTPQVHKFSRLTLLGVTLLSHSQLAFAQEVTGQSIPTTSEQTTSTTASSSNLSNASDLTRSPASTSVSSSSGETATTTTTTQSTVASTVVSQSQETASSVSQSTSETTSQKSVVQPSLAALQPQIVGYQANSPVFRIEAANGSLSKKLVSVKLAIWTAAGGQDDLRWLSIPFSAAGIGHELSIQDLPGYTGNDRYHLHLYHTYEDGSREVTNLGPLEFSIAKPSIRIESLSAGQFRIWIEQVGKHVTELKVPVWSDKNGQDDLKWYSATKVADGTWQVTVDSKQHKSDKGLYLIHLYGKTIQKPSLQFLTNSSYQLQTGQENALLTVENYKKTSSQFTVTVKGQADSQVIKSVRIAVWSGENGQDDLKWYQPSLNNNAARQEISIRDHSNTSGNYHVHAYVTYEDAGQQFYNLGPLVIEKPEVKHDVTVAQKENGYHIKVTSNDVPDLTSLRIAVWSESKGQDDLKWYTASELGEVLAAYSNHVGYGLYHFHVYSNEKGKMRYLTQTKVERTKPNITSRIEKTESGLYRITVSGVPGDIQSITVPVWSESKGQDDLKWYPAKKLANGDYQVMVSPLDHALSTGRYHAHIYGKDVTGKQFCIGTNVFQVDKVEKARLSLAITNKQVDQARFDVLLSNIVAPAQVKEVLVPVWSAEGGQDDIRWYQAVRQADGSYKITVDAANHKYSFGTYHVHAYLKYENGQLVGVGATTTQLDKPANFSRIQTSYKGMGNYSLSFQRVFTSGQVKFAVWSETAGQDDLRWYTASRADASSFTGTFSAQNHKHTGTYHIHAYENVNGKMIFLTSTTVSVSRADYAAPYYSQLDGRWSNLWYGAGQFGPTGCVPAVMAMIISGVKGQTVTPSTVANYLYHNTLEFNRNYLGTSSRGVVLSARNWGLSAQALQSKAALSQSLQAGYYVAAAVGPSRFVAGGGHELVLKGYRNGMTYVMDPYTPGNNGWYSIDYLWNVQSTDPIDRTEGRPFIQISD
ncbi:hypothetical protein HO675_03920 [Streptococcus suis]|nr:hypothetical protein [Streptococcus suis]